MKVKLRKLTIDKIRSWSSFPFNNKAIYDEKIAHAILCSSGYISSDEDKKERIRSFISGEYMPKSQRILENSISPFFRNTGSSHW